MRVNFNFGQSNHSILNVSSINKNFVKNSLGGDAVSNAKPNKDRASISPQGKMMEMLERLTEQKQSIIEKKNELVTKTVEGGSDIESIKGQLDFYNKQLESIDQQISDVYTQQAKDSLEKIREKKSGKPAEEKSEEQLESERLGNLANLSENSKRVEQIAAVKERVEGEIRVSESEVEIGQVRIDRLESKGLIGVNVKDLIASEKRALKAKNETIAELREQVSQLEANQGKKINEAVSELEDNKSVERDETDKA